MRNTNRYLPNTHLTFVKIHRSISTGKNQTEMLFIIKVSEIEYEKGS